MLTSATLQPVALMGCAFAAPSGVGSDRATGSRGLLYEEVLTSRRSCRSAAFTPRGARTRTRTGRSIRRAHGRVAGVEELDEVVRERGAVLPPPPYTSLMTTEAVGETAAVAGEATTKPVSTRAAAETVASSRAGRGFFDWVTTVSSNSSVRHATVVHHLWIPRSPPTPCPGATTSGKGGRGERHVNGSRRDAGLALRRSPVESTGHVTPRPEASRARPRRRPS